MTTLSTKGDVDGSTPSHNQGMLKTGLGKIWQVISDLFGTDSGALRTVHETFKANGPGTLNNLSLVPSVAGNALTMTVKTRAGAVPSAADPVLVGVRNATLATGDSVLRQVASAITGVISSGSTMGHTNGVAGGIYWYLVDSDGAGTMKLAFTSTYYGPSLVGSTVAEGGAGAADSATTIYSDGAYANKGMRLIGRTIDTQAVAGTWTALPTTVDLWPFDPAAIPSAATQAEMEAASVNTAYASPSNLKWHPGVAKAWVTYDASSGTPTIQTSLNVTSLTDNGVGDVTVNFTTAFSGTRYAYTYNGGRGSNTGDSACTIGEPFNANPTASAFRMLTYGLSGSAADPRWGSVIFFGDQ